MLLNKIFMIEDADRFSCFFIQNYEAAEKQMKATCKPTERKSIDVEYTYPAVTLFLARRIFKERVEVDAVGVTVM